MSEYYIVEKTSLTEIANAIRSKGKLTEVVSLPLIKQSATSKGDGTFYNQYYSSSDDFEETFVIEGASSVKVDCMYQNSGDEAATETNGYYLIINGDKYDGSNGVERTFSGEEVTISFKGSQSSYSGYYIEIYGLDADGNNMETYNKTVGNTTMTFTPEEMVPAILAIGSDGSSSSGSSSSDANGPLLKSLVERTITAFDHSEITTIGQYAFYKCTALTSVSCPAVTTIGKEAFSGCSALTSISFPEVTTFDGTYQFSSCSTLTEVSFPKLTAVADNAFRNCSNLVKADFAVAKTFTGTAFYNSKDLDLIIRSSTMATASSTGLLPAASSFTGGIYVPSALVDTYKVDSVWGTWADFIFAIEDHPEICG